MDSEKAISCGDLCIPVYAWRDAGQSPDVFAVLPYPVVLVILNRACLLYLDELIFARMKEKCGPLICMGVTCV